MRDTEAAPTTVAVAGFAYPQSGLFARALLDPFTNQTNNPGVGRDHRGRISTLLMNGGGLVRLQLGFSILLMCYCAQISMAVTTFYGPTSYFSEADIPDGFVCDLCDACVHNIETFEDDSLDFGITISAGQIIGPEFTTGVEALTDSVDGDDGVVDGVNNEGHSYFFNGNSLTITFADAVKSAGLVWTDGDIGTQTSFEAFAPDGTSLGSIGPVSISDNSFQGTVDEDSFFGAMDTDGIGSIVITNQGGSGIEIDHIQYSACDCVPEPNSLLVLAIGCLGVIGFLRKR